MKHTTLILTLLIALAGLPCHSKGMDSADADYCIDWGDGGDVFNTKLVFVKKHNNLKTFKIPRNRQKRSTCTSYFYSYSPSFRFIDKSGREVFSFDGGYAGWGGGGYEIKYKTSIALDSGGESSCVSSTSQSIISAEELEGHIKINFTDTAGLWESAVKNVKKKDILRLKGQIINGYINVSVKCEPDLDTTYRVDFRARVIGECKSGFLTPKIDGETAASDPGTFIDTRNGKAYKTVTINGETWMAENLNYQPKSGNSWCYNNSSDSCAKYGRLYDWNTAMEVCPVGWRLPTYQDWDNLITAAGGGRGAGTALATATGWLRDDDFNGTDELGFSALPGGYRDDHGFDGAGGLGYWWMAKEDNGYAYSRAIDDFKGILDDGGYFKSDGFSVRCIKGESNAIEEKKEVERKKETERKKKKAAQAVEKNTDYFTDPRDGRKYRSIKIGAQTWMAENLNYQPQSGKSWCYDNDTSNCGKYGRLYDWNTAKSVCPVGWRLPSRQEWDTLGHEVGGEKRHDYDNGIIYWYSMGETLKAKSGWIQNDGEEELISNGTDDFGFSALPGGNRGDDGKFRYIGEIGYWWTSTVRELIDGYISGYVYFRSIHGDNGYVYDSDTGKDGGLSVRCVHDGK